MQKGNHELVGFLKVERRAPERTGYLHILLLQGCLVVLDATRAVLVLAHRTLLWLIHDHEADAAGDHRQLAWRQLGVSDFIGRDAQALPAPQYILGH
jgi:hypothetical protein